MGMEVKIELGHRAVKNIKPTNEGFTHDWTVFVQGVNGNEIEHIVEKVIFHLPDSYPDPSRMRDKPPYALSESTSQSLSIRIDVFFCAEAKPRKVKYIYDVCIGENEVNASWERKLTFQNPSKEWKEKLLLSGGEVVDLLKSFPIMAGELVEIKVEPEDDLQIVNNADKATLNTAVKKSENLQNKCSMNSERPICLNKLFKENEDLKKANAEIKGKIKHQEKCKVYYKDQVSHYEKNISKTNLDINKLKEKNGSDKREISTLKLQLQMLQNKLSQIENSAPKVPEGKKKGTKRKNEDLCISAAVVEEKENVTQPPNTFFSNTLQNSSLFKATSVSIQNQNVYETVKSNTASSVVRNAIEQNGLCNFLSGNTIASFKPVNTRDVEKSIEGNSNKPDKTNNSVEESVNGSLMEVNSFLNSPEIIIDAEKPAKGNSAKGSVSLKTPEVITIDDEESVKTWSTKTDVSPNTPDVIIMDDFMSAKRSLANACTLNKFELRKKDGSKIVEGNTLKAPTSMSKVHVKPCCTSKTKEKSEIPVQELHISSTKETNINSSNLNYKEKGKLTKKDLVNLKLSKKERKEIKKLLKKKVKTLKSNSLKSPPSQNKLYTKPCSENKTQERHTSSSKITNVNSPNSNRTENIKKIPNLVDDALTQERHASSSKITNVNSPNSNRTENIKKIPNLVDDALTQERHASSSKITNVNSPNSNRTENIKKNPNLVDDALTQERHASSSKITNVNSPNSNRTENIKKIPNLVDDALTQERHASSSKITNVNSPNSNRTENIKKNPNLVDDALTQERHASSSKLTNVNSSNSNHMENAKKIPNLVNDTFSSPSLRNTKLSKKERIERSKKLIQQNFDCISEKSHEDLKDTSAPQFQLFLTKNCLKLAAELGRTKKSEFRRYRKRENNLLFRNLGNIDNYEITDERFFWFVNSLIDYFSDPYAFDMPTLIYLVVTYLSHNRTSHEKLSTYCQNQDICVHLPPSENCIVHALHEAERRSSPHLNGLVRHSLHIIHQVIVSKKGIEPNGLASLCRVFSEICKCNNIRWKPLYLCCELLRLEHPLAPFLINCLAAVWRDPFHFFDTFSVEENMLLSSIGHGIKRKPLLMDSSLWTLTRKLNSTYLPSLSCLQPDPAVKFLKHEIVSRCEAGLFQDIWMLTSPLVVIVVQRDLFGKQSFKKKYIIPNLKKFSQSSNAHGFDVFCNLYVDIYSVHGESVYEDLLWYYNRPALNQDIKDCAAVALLKYIGTTDKRIPAPLRDWFLKNQDNPKLAVLIDLYKRNLMESHPNFLPWSDVIIV